MSNPGANVSATRRALAPSRENHTPSRNPGPPSATRPLDHLARLPCRVLRQAVADERRGGRREERKALFSAADNPSGENARPSRRGSGDSGTRQQFPFLARPRRDRRSSRLRRARSPATAEPDRGWPAPAPPARLLPARSAPGASRRRRAMVEQQALGRIGGRGKKYREIGADSEIAREPDDADRDQHEPGGKRRTRCGSHSPCRSIGISRRGGCGGNGKAPSGFAGRGPFPAARFGDLHHRPVAASFHYCDSCDAAVGAGERDRGHVVGDLAVEGLKRESPVLAATVDLQRIVAAARRRRSPARVARMLSTSAASPGAPVIGIVFLRFCERFSSVSWPPSTVMRSSCGVSTCFSSAVRAAIGQRALQDERRFEQRALARLDKPRRGRFDGRQHLHQLGHGERRGSRRA